MKNGFAPISSNEMERLISLAEFDVDYDSLREHLTGLTRLAARIAGTEISLVNLIDAYTQWTISDYGISLVQLPKEESVCQFTIQQSSALEIKDLSADERFKEKDYVSGELHLRYYWGVPLRTSRGHNLGALCVLDKSQRELTPEKTELLNIIAEEIVSRLSTISVINKLKNKAFESVEMQKRLTHDIRGPIAGMINMAQMISEQGRDSSLDSALEFIQMVQKSGHTLLELADEILSVGKKTTGDNLSPKEVFNLLVFKEKLMKLYLPQAAPKKVILSIRTDAATETIPCSSDKLLQISGNLVSNAIKFTPPGGRVIVELGLITEAGQKQLRINVTDTGTGLSSESIQEILHGNARTLEGTGGEKGYGFGLMLVKHLIEGLKGQLNITSTPGKGSCFTVLLPQ